MVRIITFTLSLIALFSCLVPGQSTWAKSKGEQPGKHLKITEVLVNFDTETITIIVDDLDFGPGPFLVRLGDESGFGDITSACVDDTISVPQTITCDFSGTGLNAGLPPAGDYLVVVATGNGQSQSDEYDLTIGAVGPEGPEGQEGAEGPQGPQGLPGNLALAGQSCPEGQFLTGFDANGGILCASGGTVSSCGNAIMDAGEVCDDGNNINGDGCSADCLDNEMCGNGIISPWTGEVCDDGNNIDGDGCSADCLSAEICGDDILTPASGEECDDGNTIGGDGCSAFCILEAVCGNNIVEEGEQCDDGNTSDGDGCSAVCLLEGPQIVYFDDIESQCPGAWTLGGDWQCGAPTSGPNAAYSGTQLIATQLAGNYNNAQAWATTTATTGAIDLTGATAPQLSFQVWYRTEGQTYDGFNLKISTDGASFTVLGTVSPAYGLTIDSQNAWGGDQQSWQEYTADLSAYAGMVIYLQFGFRSDGSVNYSGVYVDDVTITD